MKLLFIIIFILILCIYYIWNKTNINENYFSGGRPHSGRSHSGRPYSGRLHSGRPYFGKPHSGRPHYDNSYHHNKYMQRNYWSGSGGYFDLLYSSPYYWYDPYILTYPIIIYDRTKTGSETEKEIKQVGVEVETEVETESEKEIY